MIPGMRIDGLPGSPGVYLFKDGDDRIIYIGKARNIRDRVRSYFRDDVKDIKTRTLTETIHTVDFILTANEKEAFLLENNLIKQHAPKYNIDLKDDKSYISLKLTVKDEYPALFATRKIVDDGSLYFGPYPHARDVRDILKIIERLYPVRKCKITVFRKRKRPCMLFELGKCPGPCVMPVDATEYAGTIGEVRDFLSGRDEKVLKDIEGRIARKVAAWDFEGAQALKERYQAIKAMTEKQHVHEHFGKNRDAWAFSEGTGRVSLVVLTFRRGVLLSRRLYKERFFGEDPGEAIMTFLFQYYGSRPIPDEIILSEEMEDSDVLEKYLTERNKGPVKIMGPSHSGVRDMVRLAVENLHETEVLPLDESFRNTLRLRTVPRRIEIYDISHIGGQNPTGAFTVFKDFRPAKDQYRVFHVRSAETMDDVAMITEVLTRRVKNPDLGPLPDLFIIDGGKGQLAAAHRVLRANNVDRDVISIAKGERRRRMEDVIYVPARKNPLALPRASAVFKEIVKMRDEAHRFAVSSHRRWRRKENLK
ncbi:MAG: UvrABC system protein C [Syntrophorhabdus sp. PtaB.Bin047]|nr:MAG: UvrABC system protein C [Syntrophorhabdus sp. PtaB.Bin047]